LLNSIASIIFIRRGKVSMKGLVVTIIIGSFLIPVAVNAQSQLKIVGHSSTAQSTDPQSSPQTQTIFPDKLKLGEPPVLPSPISPTSPPPPTPSVPSKGAPERGITNPRTGELYPGTGGGVVNPKTGAVLPKVDGGYINPRTGEFFPTK
jgi:hypothetical protein